MAEAHSRHHHHHHHHVDGGEHQHSHNEMNPSHNDRNVAHWDSVAKTYASEHTQKKMGDLINKATEFVLANISRIGVDFLDPAETFEAKDSSVSKKTVRILDYACGPGTITNILAGRATEYVGIDISPKMVEEYNRRFSSDGDSGSEKLNAIAYNANLFNPSSIPDDLKNSSFFDFDLVAVGFGFHHFEDLPMVTQRLVERIKSGGSFMILDFYSHAKEDLADDPTINTVAHHGFSEGQVKELFSSAGLKDTQVYDFGEDVFLKGHAKRRPFMAIGRKLV